MAARLPPVLLLALLAVSAACRGPVVNEPPLRPAIPTGVTRGDTGVSYRFVTSCVDPDGDSAFIRFNWGDGNVTGWYEPVASGDTIADSHVWSRTGSFQVKAQAMDAERRTTEWSLPLHIDVGLNQPPRTGYSLQGPTSTLWNSTCSYQAAAIDPDSERVAVRFSWGDGDTSGWSGWFPSGGAATMSHSWSDSGVYEVRGQARDICGATSAWSNATTVTVIGAEWRYQTGAPVRSSPAIAGDGTIYLGSSDTRLHAVSPNGTLKWTFKSNGYIESSPAVGPDGTIYFSSLDSCLYAVSPGGLLKWRYHTGDRIYSSPAVAFDGTVYVGSDDNNLHAVDPDGNLKWRHQTSANIRSSPAVAADGTVYFGSVNDYLYAVDPDGNLEWRFETDRNVTASPAVTVGGIIYVASEDDCLYALYPDGALEWCYRTEDDLESSPAVAADGTVYVGSEDNHLYALYPNGALRWRFKTGHYVYSSPAVTADGTVHVGSEDGGLYAIRSNGTLKWRLQLPAGVGSSPAIAADGTVYVGCRDGYLYAIRGDSPLAKSAWPKFRHDNRNTGRKEP